MVALARSFEALRRDVLIWITSPLIVLGWLLGIGGGLGLGYALGLQGRPSHDAMAQSEPSVQLALSPRPPALGASDQLSSTTPRSPVRASDGAADLATLPTRVTPPQATFHTDVVRRDAAKRRATRSAGVRAERRKVSRARRAKPASVARASAKRAPRQRSKKPGPGRKRKSFVEHPPRTSHAGPRDQFAATRVAPSRSALYR